MTQFSARAAAICAADKSVREIISMTWKDRVQAKIDGKETEWWDEFWRQFSVSVVNAII